MQNPLLKNMSTVDKCLKETNNYSAEDARFMEMG